MTEKRFKLHPYYGFAPIEEEPKEVKEFKFLPYHGFVPADETVPGKTKKWILVIGILFINECGWNLEKGYKTHYPLIWELLKVGYITLKL